MRKMLSGFSSDHLIANEFCYSLNHRVDQDGLMKRKEVRFHFPKQDLLIFCLIEHRITTSKSFDDGLDDNYLDDSKIASTLK